MYNESGMIFDGSSLYPYAMWDEKTVYPKIESGFAFTPHMNKVYVEVFQKQTFNQDGNESAIFNPPNLVFQHIAINKKSSKRRG